MHIIHAVNLGAVDLNLLTAFDALMTDGAVTRAGARIGRSQPAMSHALGRLRALFDDPLFVRTPAGMVPTARAHQLGSVVAPMLAELRRALEPPARFSPTESDRAFTAGMSEYAEVALTAALLRGVRAGAPRADLRIVPITHADYQPRLERRDLDVAIGNLRDVPPHMVREELYVDRLVCLGRRRHPGFGGRLTLARYTRLLHVLVSPAGKPRGAVDRLLAERGVSRRIALTVGTYLALPLVLADSDLVATLPERAARPLAALAGLAIRPLPLRGNAEVAMIWHRRDDGDPAHAWFRDQLRAATR